jgi:hypothetical protein
LKSQADCLVSPSGKIVKLVNGSHIATIIANPERFGLTKEEIVDIHKKYNEQLGSEGNARDEIIVGLIKGGWLRVNYEVRIDAFLIDANADSGDFRNQLAEFCMSAVVGELDGKERRYSDIRVSFISGGTGLSTNIETVIKEAKARGMIMKLSMRDY